MLVNKINELIENSYDVKISSSVDVSKDNFENGVIEDNINYFEYDNLEFTLNNLDNIKEDIREKINDYLDNTVYYYLDKKDENISIIDDRLCYCQSVDNDNTEPSQIQMDDFKHGLIDLYIQDINIYISINGINLNEDVLREIYPNAN